MLTSHQHKDGEKQRSILLMKERTEAAQQNLRSSSSVDSNGLVEEEKGEEDEERENLAPKTATPQIAQRDEFLINLQKFSSSINRTIQQIEGEVRLEVPDLGLSENDEANASNQALMDRLEEVCRDWYRLVTSATENIQHRTPHGNGPLAEIDFWREKNAALSALYEQLRLPKVQRFLDLFGRIDNSFDYLKEDLSKNYIEAKDNVRFLSTLERHFKNITHGTSFQAVLDTLPSMMKALRMVWIISRHYNRDERMVPLMERIAWEIAERVANVINIRNLYE